MQAQPDEVKGWLTILAALLGVGGFVQKVRSLGGRVAKLEADVGAIPDDTKRRLYDDKSQPIYMPVISCKEHQAECGGRVEKRIDRLELKIDRLIEMQR